MYKKHKKTYKIKQFTENLLKYIKTGNVIFGESFEGIWVQHNNAHSSVCSNYVLAAARLAHKLHTPSVSHCCMKHMFNCNQNVGYT